VIAAISACISSWREEMHKCDNKVESGYTRRRTVLISSRTI